jgi:hypothetical protein
VRLIAAGEETDPDSRESAVGFDVMDAAIRAAISEERGAKM